MKNVFKVLLIFTLLFSLVACNNNSSQEPVSDFSASEISNLESEISDTSIKFDSLEDFLATPKMQVEIEHLKTNIENDKRTAEIIVEDDLTVVLNIKMKEFVENAESYNEVVKNIVDSGSEIFIDFLKELELESGMNNIFLIVKYCNFDDSVLYEKTFKNDKNNDNMVSALSEIQTLKYFYEEGNGKEFFYEKAKNVWVATKTYLKSDNQLVIEQVYSSHWDTDAEQYSKYMEETVYSLKIQLANIIMEARNEYSIEEFSIVYIISNSDGSKLYEVEAFESDAS